MSFINFKVISTDEAFCPRGFDKLLNRFASVCVYTTLAGDFAAPGIDFFAGS